MLTLEEIMNLTPEEFTKNWNNNHIQDSSLKLIGHREMTEDDKKHVEDQK